MRKRKPIKRRINGKLTKVSSYPQGGYTVMTFRYTSRTLSAYVVGNVQTGYEAVYHKLGGVRMIKSGFPSAEQAKVFLDKESE